MERGICVMNKKINNLILCSFIIFFLSFSAFATVTTAGGGRWDYGANSSICWSKYNHPNLRHGSTAINGDDESDEADGIDAGEESYACVTSTRNPFHRNRAYWHRCRLDKRCGYDQD